MDVFIILMVIKAKLLVSDGPDCGGYTTYVFESIDPEQAAESKYIMCTKWPNWDHPKIELNSIGYLSCVEIVAGKDQWFDRYSNQMIPYNYDNIQFIKFIPEKKIEDTEYRI